MAGLSVYLINSLLKVLSGHESRRVETKLKGAVVQTLALSWISSPALKLRKYFSHFREGFFMSLGKAEWMSQNQLQCQLSFLPYQVQLETVWLHSLQRHHMWCIFLNWDRKIFESKKQRLRSVLVNVHVTMAAGQVVGGYNVGARSSDTSTVPPWQRLFQFLILVISPAFSAPHA